MNVREKTELRNMGLHGRITDAELFLPLLKKMFLHSLVKVTLKP